MASPRADVSNSSRPWFHTISSRSGFEETFGGGSAFFGGAGDAPSCFTIVRTRWTYTTRGDCGGENVAAGGE